jgi:hypothetical protein
MRKVQAIVLAVVIAAGGGAVVGCGGGGNGFSVTDPDRPTSAVQTVVTQQGINNWINAWASDSTVAGLNDDLTAVQNAIAANDKPALVKAVRNVAVQLEVVDRNAPKPPFAAAEWHKLLIDDAALYNAAANLDGATARQYLNEKIGPDVSNFVLKIQSKFPATEFPGKLSVLIPEGG